MENIKKELDKIAVLTSGGDAPGMNAAIINVVAEGNKQGFEVYGAKDGYLGLYNDEMQLLELNSLLHVINVSGTFLGTSRFLDFKKEITIRQKCANNLKKRGIDKLIIIGGDGSYQGAVKLQELGIKCVGIPATIDNDIAQTDFTIGFSTALSNVVDAIGKLRDTSLSHRRCSIIEVMGRYKGDLALYGGVATKADLIVTPENFLDKPTICAKIKALKEKNQRHAIVVITERMFDVNSLAKEIEKNSGFETRAQVLGHIQRGGTPTPEDLVLATLMGSFAVQLLQKNISNSGICLKGLKLIYVNFEEIFNHQEQQDNLFSLVSNLLPH